MAARKFELTYDSGAGTYQLPQPWRRLHSIRLRRLEIPLTYTSLLAAHAGFSFREDGGAAIQAVLPAGNYDVDSLKAALKVAMDAASGLGRTYTVTYNDVTGFLTVVASAGTVTMGASLVLGFDGSGGGAASVTGTRVAQPLGSLSHLLLTSPLAQRLAYPRPIHAAATSASPVSDLLAVVPLKEPPMTLLVWEPTDACPLACEKDGGAPIVSVSFALVRADTGLVVDLRGGTWSVTLEVIADL